MANSNRENGPGRIAAAQVVRAVAVTAAALASIGMLAIAGCGRRPSAGDNGNHGNMSKPGATLEIFAGAASKPATDDAVREFEEMTGVKVLVHYGGSGKMLAEMKLAGRGDIYFPGSSDFMEAAKRERLVLPETERIVAYLIPAISVVKGNPKGIKGVEDLALPGVRVGIGRPDSVCLGLYAVEMFEASGRASSIRANIVAYAESCDKTAALVSLGLVDAVIGWSNFERWDPEHIESVILPPERLPRIGYLPIAIAASSRNRDLAAGLVDFISGPQGRDVFARQGYLTTEEEARRFGGPGTPIGGEYMLPAGWP